MSDKVKDSKGYEIMPNTIKLFENKKKTKDSHPDYTGKMYDSKGVEFYVSCWTKETKNGDTFLTGKVILAEEAKEQWNKDKGASTSKLKTTERAASLPSGNEDLDDDLPF